MAWELEDEALAEGCRRASWMTWIRWCGLSGGTVSVAIGHSVVLNCMEGGEDISQGS